MISEVATKRVTNKINFSKILVLAYLNYLIFQTTRYLYKKDKEI